MPNKTKTQQNKDFVSTELKEPKQEPQKDKSAQEAITETSDTASEPKNEIEENSTLETSSVRPRITSFSQLDSLKSESGTTAKIITEELPSSGVKETGEEAAQSAAQSSPQTSEEPLKPEENLPQAPKGISSEEVKEWLKDVRPDTTKELEKGGRSFFKTLLIILVFLLIGGAIVGGFFYYQRGVSKKASEPEKPTKTAPTEISKAPTPTPEEVDISKFSISVLNGSGVAGEAAKVASLLKQAGFSEPKTGNAQSYDYTTTIVSLKQDVPNTVFEKLKEVLSDSYSVEKSETPLRDDSTYDITIIVGSKKK